MSEGMLNGITVLDVSSLAPGAFATSHLAQFGARVIKVERPTTGDPIRAIEAPADRESAFSTLNAGKRSVVVDLKTDGGWKDLGRLIATSDVIVSNYTALTAEKLGLTYGRVKKFREDIVMASITGFSSEGEMADRPGHDLNFVASAGALPLLQGGNHHAIPEFPVSDALGGATAAFAIVAALLRRFQTGVGEHVRVSLTDALLHARVSFGLHPESEEGHKMRPGYGIYETLDDQLLSVGVEEIHFWRSFCHALGLPELEFTDPMGTGVEADSARHQIAGTLKSKTAVQWEELLRPLNLPVCLVESADGSAQRSIREGSHAVRQVPQRSSRFLPGRAFLTESSEPVVLDTFAPELGEGNSEYL